MRKWRYAAVLIAVGAAFSPIGRAQDQATADPALQYELATSRYQQAQYREALDAYDAASQAADADLARRARMGKIRSALRIAEFDLARNEAERLRRDLDADADVAALYGDALWGVGLFDEAEAAYSAAASRNPELARARYGVARALATRSQLGAALEHVSRALVSSPQDPDIHALAAAIYERLGRYPDAAEELEAYSRHMPAAAVASIKTARSRAAFLRSFSTRVPSAIHEDDAAKTHAVPFRLVKNKIILNGSINGARVEWVLDTGAEGIGVSFETARRASLRPTSTILAAGVGFVGLRTVELGRANSVTIGSLRVRDVPMSIRSVSFRNGPRWQGESLSPLALGLSAIIDYKRREVIFGRTLPEEEADMRMPLRVERLPFVRGVLNAKHPAYFVVDTGGELISISSDTFDDLGVQPARRIALRVFGLSGLDPSAFLLPGVDLNIDDVAYHKVGLAVLDLRAPSVLLGFQVGGIAGHKFLGGYRVAMDFGRGELRLNRAGS